MFPQDWIVVVGQQVCAAIAKAFEGADQIIEIGVMVGVVKLQVGDHTKMGGKFHQGAIRLVCFGHQQAAFTGVAVAAITGHHSTDHGCGVFPGCREQCGDHGAGRGFAVAAGDGDRRLLVDQGCQHI